MAQVINNIVNFGAAFANLNQGHATITHPDGIWSDADIQALFQALSAVNGQNFHGFTVAQFHTAMAEFTVNAAQLHATTKTNFKTTSTSAGGMPRAVRYNTIRDQISAQQLSITSLVRTYATEVYNTMNTHNRPPLKWMAKGYKYEDRFVAFPGAEAIKYNDAQPPLSDGNLTSILANSKAIIYESQSSAGESRTTNPYYTTGVVLSTATAHRPTALQITNG